MPKPQYHVKLLKSKVNVKINVINVILVTFKHSINKTQQTVSSHQTTLGFFSVLIPLTNVNNILKFQKNLTCSLRKILHVVSEKKKDSKCSLYNGTESHDMMGCG